MARAPTPSRELAPGPPQAAALCDDAGVDLTLVRYTLALTPTERLRAIENYMNAVSTLKPAKPQ